MKLKNILFLSLFLIIGILLFIPNTVNAAVDDIFSVDKIEYIILTEEDDDYTVAVFGYNGTSKKVEIPETVIYNGDIYLVKEIGNEAFANCPTLESIVMPDSITSTWYDIFRGCTSLKEVKLSSSIKLLQYGIFGDCTSLENVTIPSSVNTIDMRAFENCTALKNVKILNFEAKIDKNAFYGCPLLKKIEGYIRSTAQTFAEDNGYDFEIIGKFDIIFNANGGVFLDEKENLTITSGEWDINLYKVIESIQQPTRQGYSFLGFFDKQTGGTSLEYFLNEGIDEAKTFYAQWEKVYTYSFITGEKQTFTLNNIDEYTFKIDGDYSLFSKITIRDLNLTKDVDFTVTEGSTIITFTKTGLAKLNTLPVGTHNVVVKYSNDKEVIGKLIVKENTENIVTEKNENNENNQNTDDISNIETSNDDATNENNPQTGDNIIRFVAILVIAVTGIIITTKAKKYIKE